MSTDNLGNENIDMAVGYSNGYKQGYEQGKKDAVKHGYWILDENEKIPCYQIKTCSLCGCRVNGTQFNFCPHCGAKMEVMAND